MKDLMKELEVKDELIQKVKPKDKELENRREKKIRKLQDKSLGFNV